jgi:hypothetical protein
MTAHPARLDDSPNRADQLQELAKLKKQNIRTEEEFQARKKQILDL